MARRCIKPLEKRTVRKKHVELSNWYNSLSDENKQMVLSMMEEAVDSALFGLLCVIDGIRTIEESEEKTTFQVLSIRDGEKTLVNNEDEESLHDLYNSLNSTQD